MIDTMRSLLRITVLLAALAVAAFVAGCGGGGGGSSSGTPSSYTISGTATNLTSGQTYTVEYVGASTVSAAVNSTTGAFTLTIPTSAISSSGTIKIIDASGNVYSSIGVPSTTFGSSSTVTIGTIALGPPAPPTGSL